MNTPHKKLTDADIDKKLGKTSEWSANAKRTELTKTFTFSNFVNGLAFVAKVAVHAEVMNHHPIIELSYGKVRVKLSTHDVKGITNLDFDLAKRIDVLRVA